ncbi:MAG: hypothetical protein AB7T06_39590 [Kofleriaceae bacterium]
MTSADDLDLGDELALEASILRDSFADFARWGWPRMTGLPFVDNTATQAIVAVLQAVADGRLWRTLIAVAPGLGKSTLLALFSAWRFARRADWRGLHAMAASTDANRESMRVRRLVTHDDFRALFPAVVLRDDENTISAWATRADGRYYALGLDGAITSKRVHELVCDDLMSAQDRHSKAERQRVWTWLEESATSRLDGDRAPITVVAQRLDRDDVHGRAMAAGGWVMLSLTAEREANEEPCEIYDHAGELVWRDTREVGELLAPQMLSREKLASIPPAVRRTQYFQSPSDDETATIKRAWWRWYHTRHVSPVTPRPHGCDTSVPAVPMPEGFSKIVIACDLTFGAVGPKSDFVAIQAWGASGAGRFLLARFHKRCGLLESVAAIKAMRERFPNAKVIVELAANGRGSIEELKAAGVHGVVGVKPLGSKADRVGVVSATIEAGDCYLPLGMPGIGEFVEELAGATKHDDEQDAAAYAIHELNRDSVRTTNDSVPGHAIAEHVPTLSWRERRSIGSLVVLGGRGGRLTRSWR